MNTLISFFQEMVVGRLRWDLLNPFPQRDPADSATGDRVVAELTAFLREQLDPAILDRDERFPAGFVDELRKRRYLALRAAPESGGLGLSDVNTFRVLTAASSWSVAVGFLLAIQNGLGAGAYLPGLAPGPLHDLIRHRIAKGAIFGMADTEPAGAANTQRTTTASPVEGGYLLDGKKIFVGNGPIADLLVVSASVGEDVGLFCVNTSSPRFTVSSVHQYLGLRGLPSGALRLDGVKVPTEHQIVGAGRSWRENKLLADTVARGRLYLMAAPSLAITRLCAHWSRVFVPQRQVDGRSLDTYDQVQRIVATTVSEVFALDSVISWIMLGGDRVDIRPEQVAAKNITSVTCWRAIDRTLSLLGAEGLETAESKAHRKALPLPVERFFRDARVLRVAGGVDFLVDLFAAHSSLFGPYYPAAPDNATEIDAMAGEAVSADDTGLTPRNQDHLTCITANVRQLARTCLRLSRQHPNPARLFEQQNRLINLYRIASELLTMSVTLARATGFNQWPDMQAQDLADVYCTDARHRLIGWWHRANQSSAPSYGSVTSTWIAGGMPEMLCDVAGVH